MTIFLESLAFGLAVAFMFVGLIGTVIPLLPGALLIWLTVLVYAIATGFTAIDPLTFVVITLIALVTGTADIWLSLVGAKSTGASARALLLGIAGAVIGFFIFNLLGALLGYALGILLGEYSRQGDWNLALKASVGGLAGWGLASAVQLGGGLMIMAIFVWRVLFG